MVCWNKKWLLGLEWSQEEKGDILPPSLPPCSNSGEQRPSMKELESQPFLVQLIAMNNTILITSYCSLQVLKVLCMEEGSVGHSTMVSRGSSGLLRAPSSCLLSTESWDRFKLSTLTFYWTSPISCFVCFYTEQHMLSAVFCFITTGKLWKSRTYLSFLWLVCVKLWVTCQKLFKKLILIFKFSLIPLQLKKSSGQRGQ